MTMQGTQLRLDSVLSGMPAPPWPPALVCEAYGTAGNWRIRCSLPGHEPGFGLWGGTEAENRRRERDHRAWHDSIRCTAITPEGVCEWMASDHRAREPMHLQPNVSAAREGAYRGGTWHAFEAVAV